MPGVRGSGTPVFRRARGVTSAEGRNTDDDDAAARGPKTLWMIPETGHTGGLEGRPAQYEQRIVSFLDEAVAGA